MKIHASSTNSARRVMPWTLILSVRGLFTSLSSSMSNSNIDACLKNPPLQNQKQLATQRNKGVWSPNKPVGISKFLCLDGQGHASHCETGFIQMQQGLVQVKFPCQSVRKAFVRYDHWDIIPMTMCAHWMSFTYWERTNSKQYRCQLNIRSMLSWCIWRSKQSVTESCIKIS